MIDLKSLFEHFLQSRYIIILGSAFRKYYLSTVTVILWESHNPLLITQEFWKLHCLLVSMRSIHFGLLEFL